MIKLRHGLVLPPVHERVVIRGELEPETLLGLQVDWYQRGVVNPKKIKELMEGIEQSSENFPDLTIGMRGEHQEITNSEVILHDPTFIIDGLQRWTACIMLMEKGILPYMGCKVFLKSDIDFELRMFRDLNSKRTSMSASVLLRNEKEYSRVAGTLWGLARDPTLCALRQGRLGPADRQDDKRPAYPWCHHAGYSLPVARSHSHGGVSAGAGRAAALCVGKVHRRDWAATGQGEPHHVL